MKRIYFSFGISRLQRDRKLSGASGNNKVTLFKTLWPRPIQMTLWLEAFDLPSSSFTLTPAVSFLGKEGELLCKHQGLLEDWLVCVWSWLPQRTDSLRLPCSSISQEGHFLIGCFKKKKKKGGATDSQEGGAWMDFFYFLVISGNTRMSIWNSSPDSRQPTKAVEGIGFPNSANVFLEEERSIGKLSSLKSGLVSSPRASNASGPWAISAQKWPPHFCHQTWSLQRAFQKPSRWSSSTAGFPSRRNF